MFKEILTKNLQKILFLLGFFSLWLIPGYYRLNLPYLFWGLYLLLVISYFVLYQPKKKWFVFIKVNSRFFLFALLYFFVVTGVALFHRQLAGMPPAIVYLSVFLFSAYTAFLGQEDIPRLSESYFKGLWYSSLFTSLYMLFEVGMHFFRYEALNLILFPEFMLRAAGDHTYFNEDYTFFPYLGRPLFRPGGLSWDPGLTTPALVLVFILVFEGMLEVPWRRTGLALLFVAILISTSKTAWGGLLAYAVSKFFWGILDSFPKTMRRWLESAAPLAGLVFFFLLGFLLRPGANSHSAVFHLSYFSSLYYLSRATLGEIIFGFGYRRTGSFFHTYVPGTKENPSFSVHSHADVESLLTNVFLWGGLAGSLYWIYSYSKAYSKGSRSQKIWLLALLALAFGYNFHTLWFLISYHLFLWQVLLSNEKVSQS